MSQFTDAILESHKQLTRRFDHLLTLRNQPTPTVDADAHYAIFRLAELVATQFPSADNLFPWQKESLSYSLPGPWQKDAMPYWLIECPRLQASYDDLLAADDALTSVGNDGQPFLFVSREFIVDSTKARVTIEAYLPTADAALLRLIGKLAEEYHSGHTSTVLTC